MTDNESSPCAGCAASMACVLGLLHETQLSQQTHWVAYWIGPAKIVERVSYFCPMHYGRPDKRRFT